MNKIADNAALKKQLKKVKKLCKNEKCDINPKILFDTSLCPGNMLSWSMIIAGFTFWIKFCQMSQSPSFYCG